MIDRGVGMGGGGLQNLGGEGAGLEGTWASVSTVMQRPYPWVTRVRKAVCSRENLRGWCNVYKKSQDVTEKVPVG